MGGGVIGGAARLPGAVGLSRLRVYDTPAPDGLVGGSAHVHLASEEAYVVVAGRGAVQTVGPDGPGEVPLEPGTVVWFSPGIVHRLVSEGTLDILVVMQNAGLPEAGDAVLTFPNAVLADPVRYAEAAALPDGPGAGEAARRRRDLAVEGFVDLRGAAATDGGAAVRAFYDRAVALVAHRVPDWRSRWEAGASAATSDVARRLAGLDAGRIEHLFEATLRSVAPAAAEERFGMCGRIQPVDPGGAADW